MDSVGGDYGYAHERFGAHGPFVFMLLFGIFLFFALGGGTGFYAAHGRHRTRREIARKAVFDDIRRAADRALAAEGADLIGAAQRLVEIVQLRLGAVSELTKAVSAPLEAIGKALAGKIVDPVKPPPPPKPPTAETTVIVNPPSCSTTVNVIETVPEVKEAPKPEPEKPKERDMTLREQLASLRQAVEAFSGLWEEGRVDALLRAAQSALLDAEASESPARRYPPLA